MEFLNHFCCIFTLLLLWFYTAASETAFPLSPYPSKNCPTKCGNVQIPYPYGIGKGCYWKKHYEIFCDRSNKDLHKPYLKSLQLEVLGINVQSEVATETESGTMPSTYDASILVRMPMFTLPCSTGKVVLKSKNLTGTPYFFSSSNQLIVVGCDLRATMTDTGSQFMGCKSTCDVSKDQEQDKISASCDGYKCCQTPISPRLQVFSLEIEPVNTKSQRVLDGGGGCQGTAFLTNESFSPPNVSKIGDVGKIGYMPVKLDWYLDDYLVDADERVSFVCSSLEPDSISGFAYNYSSCGCGGGFEGNVYIQDGCKDIDECKIPKFDGSQRCGEQVCKNTGGSYKCEPKKTWAIVLGLSIGFGVLILVVGIWRMIRFIQKRKIMKRKIKLFKRNGGLLLQQRLDSSSGDVGKTKVFTSKELENATDKFSKSRILGQGGQGTVYKGMLLDGRIVAVKKSKVIDEDKLEEFINEIVILSQIDHRNIVKLLGCCLETDVPILVYEFIPNGDLFHHIHDEFEDFPMSWETRLRIASEIADSLSYLHSAASKPIYHRDIKSTNILLDEKYRAKIADFGASRSITIDDTHKTMTFVIGTFGYIDPEYVQSNRFTEKSDVYSFGVVLVELLTGQKSVLSSGPLKGTFLGVYFKQGMKKNTLFEILDPRIKENHDKAEIMAVANLARKCLSLKGKKRPTMKEVAIELGKIRTRKSDLQTQLGSDFDEDSDEFSIDLQDSYNMGVHTSRVWYRENSYSFDSDPLVFYNTS